MTAIVCTALEVETSTLVRIYNELSDRPVKKFSDRKTAIRRVDQLLADRGMEMVQVDDEEIQVRVAGSEVDETEDAEVLTEVSTVDQSSVDLIQRGPMSGFVGRRVVVLVSNPKRKGSRAYELFSMYERTDSVDDYLDAAVRAGYLRRDALANLNWDVRHGFVRVELPESSK